MKQVHVALEMTEKAVLNANVEHLAPSMAIVIGLVRAVLSTSECLRRDSPNLQLDSRLVPARKAVLGELAKLVAQTRKIGEEDMGDLEFEQEVRKTFQHSGRVYNNTQKFVALAMNAGIPVDEHSQKNTYLPDGYAERLTGASTSTESNLRLELMRRAMANRRGGSDEMMAGKSASALGHTRQMSASSIATPQVRSAKSMVDIRNTARANVAHAYYDGGAQPMTPAQSALKAARRTRVINGQTPRTQAAIESIQAQARHRGQTSSVSSASSAESSPNPPTNTFIFPSGPCPSPVVISALRIVLDSLLGVTAAFIGHAQLHSRTSHPSSKGTLIILTREFVDLIRKLLTIVEAVIRHPEIVVHKRREVATLLEFKDTVYTETNKAVDGVRYLTNLPPIASDQEEAEKAPVVGAVTDTLKIAAECGGSLRLCLSQPIGEELYIIHLPILQTSSPAESIPNYSRVNATPQHSKSGTGNGHGRSESNATPKANVKRSLSALHKRATSLNALRGRFEQDGRELDRFDEQQEYDSSSDADVERRRQRADSLESQSEVEEVTVQPAAPKSGQMHQRLDSISRPRGDSASSAETDVSRIFEGSSDDGHVSSARTSGNPGHLPGNSSVLADIANGQHSVFSAAGWEREHRDSTASKSEVDNESLSKPSLEYAATSDSHVYEPSADLLTNSEGVVIGATFDALVRRLTHPDNLTDRQLMSYFLLTFRLFSSPEELCNSLMQRYQYSPPAVENGSFISKEEWRNKTSYVRARVLNLITEWLRYHWFGERDRVVLPAMMEFMQDVIKNGGDNSEAGRRLLKKLQELRDASADSASPILLDPKARMDRAKSANHLRDVTYSGHPTPTTPLSASPSDIPRPSMTKGLLTLLRSKAFAAVPLLEFEPLEMARQLTLMESYLFCDVPPEEVIEVGIEGRRTPHVKAISSLSTAITGWITDNILKEGLELKKRVAYIKFFIKVGRVSSSIML